MNQANSMPLSTRALGQNINGPKAESPFDHATGCVRGGIRRIEELTDQINNLRASLFSESGVDLDVGHGSTPAPSVGESQVSAMVQALTEQGYALTTLELQVKALCERFGC